MSNPEQEWIAIAKIMRPQGRKGEVLAELLTDQLGEFSAGRILALMKSAESKAEPEPVVLEEHWMPTGRNAGRIVLKLQGTDSITHAELLSGKELAIPVAELPELEEDTFYVRDLIGCQLVDHGKQVGEVVDVQFATSPDGRLRLEDAAPLLCVMPKRAVGNAEALLVPLVKAYLQKIDIGHKRITMELPPGLLELEQADDET